MTTSAGPAKKSIDTADSILPTKHRQARYIIGLTVDAVRRYLRKADAD